MGTVDHAGALGAVATTNIWFGIGAPPDRFVIPKSSEPWRADELWRTTCFEAFLMAEDGAGYREWNFAPTGNWAAYDFTGYREGMERAEVGAPPYIRMEDNFTWWAVGATIGVEADRKWRLGLCRRDRGEGRHQILLGARASRRNKPDFHDPGCFVARLP